MPPKDIVEQTPALLPVKVAQSDPEVLSARKTLEERQAHPVAKALDDYLHGVDDYRDALRIAMPAVAKAESKRHRETLKRLKALGFKEQADGTAMLEADSAHAANQALDLAREADKSAHSKLTASVARSLLIGLFSEYDNFIGNLLKAIYIKKPSLFKGITKEISLAELLEYQSLEEVKRDILEKEIDAFRRESYVEQFAILERKFELKTLRTFPEWTAFVELSQRRNVMTHNGGRVSEQYLLVCQREGYAFSPRPQVGTDLELEPEYMTDAIYIVRKVGFMLTHTLWNKVLPGESSEASTSFNDSHFELLKSKRWRTAAELGVFGLSDQMARGMDDLTRYIRVVNTAIALRGLGKKDDAIKLLDQQDWSASVREFKLANAILRDQNAEAAGIMREIGKKGELIDEVAYHRWPLFDSFQDTKEFLNAYEAIYGSPFLAAASENLQSTVERLEQAGRDRDNRGKSNKMKPARPRSFAGKKRVPGKKKGRRCSCSSIYADLYFGRWAALD